MASMTRRRAMTTSYTYDAHPRLTLLGVLLTIGIVTGILLGRELAAPPPSRVSDADYVVMVADLFDRERSVLNARERFALIGQTQPAEFVERVLSELQSSGTAGLRDVELAEQLARSLRETNPEAAGQATSSTTGESLGASEAAGSGMTTIARLFVFLLVLGAVVGFLARSGFVPLARIGRVADLAVTYGRRAIDASRRQIEARFESPAWSGDRVPESSDGYEVTLPRVQTRDLSDLDRHVAPTGGTLTNGMHINSSKDALIRASETPRQTWNGRPRERVTGENIRFEATYRSGDDANDDLHPIIEARNGILIGAFGLSPARRVPGGPVYGFTVWLHDYAGGDELAALGLVTKGGLAQYQRAVEEWQRRGDITDLFILERGLHTRIRTRNIAVDISLANVEFAPDGYDAGVLELTLTAEVVTHGYAALHVQ